VSSLSMRGCLRSAIKHVVCWKRTGAHLALRSWSNRQRVRQPPNSLNLREPTTNAPSTPSIVAFGSPSKRRRRPPLRHGSRSQHARCKSWSDRCWFILRVDNKTNRAAPTSIRMGGREENEGSPDVLSFVETASRAEAGLSGVASETSQSSCTFPIVGALGACRVRRLCCTSYLRIQQYKRRAGFEHASSSFLPPYATRF
jgi:hypothetical protein